MKKLVIVFLSIIILGILASAVFAQDDKVENAYTCLKSKLGDNCGNSNSVEQIVFSLLAMGYDSGKQGQCRSALMGKSSDNKCWPKSSCNLRDTALATIALNYIGQDASNSEQWLIDHSGASDLEWYLEIDATTSDNVTSCTIKYDNSTSTSNSVTINADKKLSVSGSCLTLANSNYWLKIDKSCINKNFKVSCNKDFVSALLYKKSDADTTWHVSSKTESASANGVTENKVNSLCAKQNNACNYEGSLWTALALQKNHDVSAYLPYLIAFASDNEKLSPYTILYILTGSDEYLNNIRATQSSSGFWDLSSSYGKFYDTSLALLALQQITEDTATKSKDWLLSVQDSGGCWNNNNIRDTASVLYSAWPKAPTITSGGDISYCEDVGKNCSSQTECIDAEGEVLSNFACHNSLKICCSKTIVQKTCSEKDGVKCGSDENCDGDSVSASDSSDCCVGECVKVAAPACEQNSFVCKTSCSDTEEEKIGTQYACTGSDLCCGAKPATTSYWWLWLLIILIILVVLAIIFRNRLRLWVFQIKNKFKKGSVTQTRPGFPPSSGTQGQQRPMMRPMPSQQARPMQRPVQRPSSKQPSKTDKELDETLKKLRDMSK